MDTVRADPPNDLLELAHELDRVLYRIDRLASELVGSMEGEIPTIREHYTDRALLLALRGSLERCCNIEDRLILLRRMVGGELPEVPETAAVMAVAEPSPQDRRR